MLWESCWILAISSFVGPGWNDPQFYHCMMKLCVLKWLLRLEWQRVWCWWAIEIEIECVWNVSMLVALVSCSWDGFQGSWPAFVIATCCFIQLQFFRGTGKYLPEDTFVKMPHHQHKITIWADIKNTTLMLALSTWRCLWFVGPLSDHWTYDLNHFWFTGCYFFCITDTVYPTAGQHVWAMLAKPWKPRWINSCLQLEN